MPQYPNHDLIRVFTGLFEAADLSGLEDLVTPDYVAHTTDGDVVGADGWRRFVRETVDADGPLRSGIDELIGDGDLVAERWWMASADQPPIHGITMHRIVDGRLAEDWAVFTPDD